MLITLAIIGVVAALTIPTVVAKYQKAQYYTQFMKTYNTLSESLSMSQAENGNFGSWTNECNGANCVDMADKFIAPFLKVAKTCDSSNVSECFPLDKMKGLSDSDTAVEYADNLKNEWLDDISRAYLLQDGSSFVICEFSHNYGNEYIVFFIDTNGPKEPNRFGRDIFMTELRKNGLKPSEDFVAAGAKDSSGRELSVSNCDPNASKSRGDGCAARLLLEGKMNY